MRTILFSLLFVFCTAVSADAQTFLNQLKQSRQGEGKVTVTQSQDIDRLINGLNPQKAPAQQKTTPTTPATPATQKPKTNTGGSKAKATTPQTTTNERTPKERERDDAERATRERARELVREREKEKEKEEALERRVESRKTEQHAEEEEMSIPTVDMSKKVMRRSHKVTGYRVQAFAGGNTRKDKQRAQQIGNDIKMRFPDEPVYVHFYSPRWICRVGNFRSYGDAQRMLKSVRAMGYKSATIVKGMITVQY